MASVLVVDDEKSIRMALSAFLRRAGHEVTTAASAEESFAQLASHQFDVLLVDIVMPRVSGLDLLDHVHREGIDVEVVVITGEPNVDTAIQALKRGAFDYLRKPVTGDEVCRVVVRAAGAKALRDENRRLSEDNRRHAEHLEEMVTARTAALQESEERFRRIFEHGPLGMALVDEEHRPVRSNLTLRQMLGYSEAELCARPLSDLIHPDDRDRAESLTRALMDRELPSYQFEERLQRRDGTWLWAGVTATVIRDEQGRVLHGLRMVEDISQRKAAEVELHDYREQLRSLASRLALAEEQERRRIAMDLHDVAAQNLALAMMGLRELQESAEDDEVSERIGRLHGLIETTALELRSLSGTLSPPMLYTIGLEAALETLAAKLEAELGIEFRFEDDGLSKELGHDARTTLYRCAAELLANVSRHAQASRVTVSIRRAGPSVEVQVRDNGRGFDASRVGTTMKEHGGFGLFSVRERMRALGGSATIRSAPGQGTTTVLLMPADTDDNGSQHADDDQGTARR